MPDNQKLFDIENIEDLPIDLQKEIINVKISKTTNNIMNLLKLSEDYKSIDEILVGYYRLYNKQINRQYLVTKLYRMSKQYNEIKRSNIGNSKKAIYKFELED